MRLFAIFFLLAALVSGFVIDDKTALTEFKDWYKTYSGPPTPAAIRPAYTKALTDRGLSPAEISERIDTLKRIVGGDPSMIMSLHFDSIYTKHPELYIQEPNRLLAAAVKSRKPGKALDVAMGQGRNTVFLATQGWDATGYDISETGMAIARASAAKAGVQIRTVRATHADFDYGTDQWDLIVLCYSLVNFSDAAFVAKLHNALKVGGIVVVENPLYGGTGKGPANALFGSFAKFRVVHYEDLLDTAEWSRQPTRIGRLIAEKE